MASIDDYLDVPEVARRTGYSELTVRSKIRSGILPAIRRGRRLYVRPEDLDALFSPIEDCR
ncbi:helix-turn-helix domain-containing protein [Gordonia sp. 1D]|uniref:helix-turn-helix domain-containing protein n=1 Tax=Gordonia sp. 1D TaxID=1737359 RepID=UPI000BB87567|nr:helix-turn-helix domain-containing protein [Gordonia sp. 1D]ATD70731.1 helix-turn-helix domain-containing protein [Gordonia sp. 1D]